jgi:hypothetical protein
MQLQKPKNATLIIAGVLVALGVLGNLIMIPVISSVSFWLVLAGFVVLVLGSRSSRDIPSPNAGQIGVSNTVSDIRENRKSKKLGLQIAISLVFSVVGYALGSEILPMLSFTNWERYAASQQASYLGTLNSAYSESQTMGGILGAIIFFFLGMVIMHFIINTAMQDR